jgi:hypothetical protein
MLHHYPLHFMYLAKLNIFYEYGERLEISPEI